MSNRSPFSKKLLSRIKTIGWITVAWTIVSIHQFVMGYMTNYGVGPVFKAGLHYGHVMAGEIGVVKREIAFSGDVLNTTARIQDKCNELGEDILASKLLIDKLNLRNDGFRPQEIGDMELRGKKEPVTLFTV